MSTNSVREAANKSAGMVYGEKVEYTASSNNYFGTDQPLGSTPTLYISLTGSDGRPVENFWLDTVRHYLDVNGGVHTYQLYLLEDTQANDVQSKGDLVYDSASAKAEATAYEQEWHGRGSPGAVTTAEYQLPKIVKLAVPGRLYYMIDWSTAPTSSVNGYIKVRGRPLLA